MARVFAILLLAAAAAALPLACAQNSTFLAATLDGQNQVRGVLEDGRQGARPAPLCGPAIAIAGRGDEAPAEVLGGSPAQAHHSQ